MSLDLLGNSVASKIEIEILYNKISKELKNTASNDYNFSVSHPKYTVVPVGRITFLIFQPIDGDFTKPHKWILL